MRARRGWLVGLAVVLAAAGCGDKKKGGEGGRSRARRGEGTRPLGELIEPGAGKPVLPAPFTAAKLGGPAADLRSKVKEVADDDYYRSPDFAGVSYYVALSDDKQTFEQVRLGVPTGAQAVLEAAWGKPVVLKEHDKEVPLWLNPELGLRVTLEQLGSDFSVVYQAYTPLATLLGEGKDHFGFETASMLGQPIAELEKAYDKQHDRTLDTLAFFKWGATEYSERFQMEVGVKDGKATSQQFWLHHGDNAEVKAALLDLMVKKFGASREEVQNPGPYEKKVTLFDGNGFTARIAETTGAWVVETELAAPPPAGATPAPTK